MKVLLLGNAADYHRTLAAGLRKLGHEVVTAGEGGDFDIDLTHGSGTFGESLFMARLAAGLSGKLKGFDVVQLASPDFLTLSPARLKKMVTRLKASNGAVYLTSIGDDSLIVSNLTGSEPALAYSHWKSRRDLRPWSKSAEAGMASLLEPARVNYAKELYSSVDGVIAATYENYKVVSTVLPDISITFGGIPVEGKLFAGVKPDFKGELTCAVEKVKKNDDRNGLHAFAGILQMAEVKGHVKRALVPELNADTVSGCAMLSDDIYSHSPGLVALEAMAAGIVPVGGAEEAFYDLIGEATLRPSFNIDTDRIKVNYKEFVDLLGNRGELVRMSAQGPEFVRKHFSPEVVAKRFVDFWKK